MNPIQKNARRALRAMNPNTVYITQYDILLLWKSQPRPHASSSLHRSIIQHQRWERSNDERSNDERYSCFALAISPSLLGYVAADGRHHIQRYRTRHSVDVAGLPTFPIDAVGASMQPIA
jgi:hypothetical protein